MPDARRSRISFSTASHVEMPEVPDSAPLATVFRRGVSVGSAWSNPEKLVAAARDRGTFALQVSQVRGQLGSSCQALDVRGARTTCSAVTPREAFIAWFGGSKIHAVARAVQHFFDELDIT
jgi:hypothetical protein